MKQALLVKRNKGMALLLVVLIVTSLMTIALSIFNFIITELKISGETADSFYAIAAADQGMEKAFYVGRVIGPYPDDCPNVPNCTETKNLSNGSCYTFTADTSSIIGTTILTSVGKFECAVGSLRQSTRSLQSSYK